MKSFWFLPGPADFVERVRRDLSDGKNVVIAIPSHGPSELISQLRSVVSSSWYWRSLVAIEGRSPLAQLGEALGFDLAILSAPEPAALLKVEGLGGTIICVDGISSAHWLSWKPFLMAYEAASRQLSPSDRALFVILLEGSVALQAPVPEVALSVLRWDGAVNELDMLLYAWHALNGAESNYAKRHLLALTIAKVAQWDREVADRLLEGGASKALAPIEVLSNVALERGWTAALEPTWERGARAWFEGKDRTHSAICALRPSEHHVIRRRLWSAQSTVLLPLIEELRIDLLPRIRRFVRLPIETPQGRMEQLEDIEIGVLHYVLSDTAADRGFKHTVDRLRRARNQLAHLEPLEPSAVMHSDFFGA